jgi:hypothetical protein
MRFIKVIRATGAASVHCWYDLDITGHFCQLLNDIFVKSPIQARASFIVQSAAGTAGNPFNTGATKHLLS